MRAFLPLLLLSLAGVLRGERISVSFPAERQRLPFVSETYVTGAVNPGRTETLYVNGATTAVYRTGAFVQMVPVKPGTNVLTVCRGGARLVRSFVVAAPAQAPSKPPPVIDSDDSPLIGDVGAWRTTGSLFTNRVRSSIEGPDSLFFLPRDFVLCGAEVEGTNWIVVWLENRRGFLPKSAVTRLTDGTKPPPKGLLAPNPADGFPDRPPYGKPPEAVTICVDAGHGGRDPGTLSPHGWREKEANLMQARAIRAALEKAGFNVLMTRDGDSFPGLLARPTLAFEERADAFISVHHNATAPQRDPRLVRYTATYASTSNGLALATCIQKHIAQVMAPVKNVGAQMKSLAVCRNPAVPSCLIEVDFINLPEGEEGSWDPTRQKKIADAVVYGVLDWMTPPLAAAQP
ncbi:MAG: N-acetylmuramoyl-L-alanine amidase [Kiritimatiellia bacterium]